MMCIICLSKMVQLVTLQDVQTVTDKLLSMVVSLHGLPECITSDHDLDFVLRGTN